MFVYELFEDFAMANLVTTESSMFADIVTARALIGAALIDSQNNKHRYFEFLKKLSNQHGPKYSTNVHRRASRLTSNHKDVIDVI